MNGVRGWGRVREKSVGARDKAAGGRQQSPPLLSPSLTLALETPSQKPVQLKGARALARPAPPVKG